MSVCKPEMESYITLIMTKNIKTHTMTRPMVNNESKNRYIQSQKSKLSPFKKGFNTFNWSGLRQRIFFEFMDDHVAKINHRMMAIELMSFIIKYFTGLGFSVSQPQTSKQTRPRPHSATRHSQPSEWKWFAWRVCGLRRWRPPLHRR